MEIDVKLTFGILLALLRTAYCASCSSTTIGESSLNIGNTDDTTPGQGYLMGVAAYAINCCGVVDKWEAKFTGVASSGNIAFQVWRPVSGSTYELVGENNFVITSDGTQELDVAVGNEISVQSGDKWGWWTSGLPMIQYKGTGASRTDDNLLLVLSNLNVGQQVDWSTATEEDDRSYSARLHLAPGNPPSFTNLPQSKTITNDVTSGTSLITVGVTDDDPYDIGSLTVTLTTSTTEFNFDSATLLLSTGTLTTNNGTVTLAFKVADPCDNSATATYTVNIINTPPVIHNTPSSVYLNEDVTNEQLLFTVNATDSETVTCSPGTGFATANFDIRLIPSSTYYGIYSRASPGFDYDTQNQYDLLVNCVDSVNTVTGTYIVYLRENQAPVITNLQNSTSVSTSTGLGTVFTVLSTDQENDNVYYNMTCSPSSCPFTINSAGQVQLTQDLTGHTTVGYDLFITVSDSKNTAGPETLTITIADINDPVIISNLPLVSALSVSENTALATSVYTVSYSDNDVSQAHTWSMTSSPTAGLTYFSIDSNGLITTTGSVIDFETMASTSITFNVTVADPVTSDSELLVVDIIDINEAPSFSQASYSLSATEGAAGTVLGTPSFAVTDPDSGDNQTFTMDCGASASYFLMAADSGQVTFQTDYDLDTGTLPSSVVCTVTVTDRHGLTDTASLTISVADINDNTPTFAPDSYTFYVSYYASSGTTVGALTATDGDSGSYGTMTYVLNQTSLGVHQFAIDASGVMSVYLAPNSGSSRVNYSSSYSLTVTVTDGGGLTDTASVTIVVSDTTTAAPTTTTPRYKKFFEGPYNLAWFVPCMVSLVTTVLVTCWVVYTCRGEHGCKAVLKSLKRNVKFRPKAGRSKPFIRDPYYGSYRQMVATTTVRQHPPPKGMQSWRQHLV